MCAHNEPHKPRIFSTLVADACDTSPALGTYAKYKNKTSVDLETGEILGKPSPMEATVQRFTLQSVARKFLPKTRTDACLRLRQNSKQIEVLKSKKHEKTFYAGLQTCGSVWACPVCAAKIAERRRGELEAAMSLHQKAGGVVSMLTLTCPHQRGDNLKELLAKQAKALNRFYADRATKAVMAEMGVLGQVRALEVTHGRKSEKNNGWHPHYHILLFAGMVVDKGLFEPNQLMDWQLGLYMVWKQACKVAGLGEPSFEHGIKLDDGNKAAQYVSKWGLEDEMTKGHIKKGRAGGETPFDFLRAYLADKNDKQAGALFKEYAETFKGKRQLHWSKGLKKIFAIGEKSDEEISASVEDSAYVLGNITLEQWRDVLAADGRGFVLKIAQSDGWNGVHRYLESIRDMGVKKKYECP
jgi:Replication protein